MPAGSSFLLSINAARQSAPVADAQALTTLLQQAAPDAPELIDLLGTQSHWFEIETETEMNGMTYRGRSIVSREQEIGTIRTHLKVVEVEG